MYLIYYIQELHSSILIEILLINRRFEYRHDHEIQVFEGSPSVLMARPTLQAFELV